MHSIPAQKSLTIIECASTQQVLRSSTPPCANGRWSTLVSAPDVLIIAGRQGGHQHQVYQGESIVQKKLNGRPSHPDARNESKVYQKSGLKCRAERARVGVF